MQIYFIPWSSLMGHFRMPMPLTGSPLPIPMIFRFLAGLSCVKLAFLVERQAKAPVSIHMNSILCQKVSNNYQLVSL
jgi:hypothetical protein